MDTGVTILQMIGTLSFAVSGAMTAMRKGMDLLGVVVLGLITAVGGGILRDVLLGRTPPAIFSDPLTAVLAVGVSVLVFIPTVRRLLSRTPRVYEVTMRWADSLGLGIFTVIGAQTACGVLNHANWFTIAFLGTITGVGGGVLRDVLAGDQPYIFRKHIYALASLAGALVWVAVHRIWNDTAAMFIGGSVVVIIRLLAAHFRWSLPKAKAEEFV
ncbi:MAG: TRIC cation channel family protein [Oscillospiraceae bacterium]|nr:TRIC cation channel family protein [Oscillospiraceae bacterium]